MATFFLIAFPVVTLVNLVLCLAWLARPGRVDIGRVAATAGLLVLANGLEALLLSRWRLHPFGWAQLAWLDLAVVVPACGLAVWCTALRRRSGPGARVVAALALLMIPIAVDAWWLTPRDTRLERVAVPLAPGRSGDDPLRIGVLADLQCTSVGDHERRAVARLLAEEPDLILVPGDMYQGPLQRFDQELPAFRELIGSLHAPGGVFVVSGNAEPRVTVEPILEGSEARLLSDEWLTVTVGDRTVEILGLEDRTQLRGARHPLPEALLARFVERPDDGAIRLVLVHRPGWVRALPAWGHLDLLVAGHTHGGQVSLPWLGPPLTLSPLPRAVAAGGLHELDGRRLYISRGLGMERLQAPRVRWRVPPEVTLLTLTGGGPGDAPSGDGAGTR